MEPRNYRPYINQCLMVDVGLFVALLSRKKGIFDIMSAKMSVQDIILTLQKFWADQGAMLMEAYDTEKGAGTMSPFTFLRANGPEPWHAAYVEPSRRPADGRYGDNPNRLYQHHQFK